MHILFSCCTVIYLQELEIELVLSLELESLYVFSVLFLTLPEKVLHPLSLSSLL